MVRCYHVWMNPEKFFVIPLLILGAFIIYHSSPLDNNYKASIWTNNEREFFRPVQVVWQGKIISTMSGGACVGLEGDFDNYTQAMACLPDMNSNELRNFEGMVTVTGKWTGITCAYKNTIFGECVPDVMLENIK